jgi:predicted MFS family arabinose efflux permease
MAWLIGEVDIGRRGSVIGRALAAGIAGALFGPVIGTLAHALGRAPVFSAVAVVAAALAVAVALLPSPSAPPEPGPMRLWEELRRPAIALGMWLTALPAVASGVLNVLAPLRLSALGATAVGIGTTFLIAAGAEAIISPAVGKVSDRRGRMFPLRIGLAAAAVVLVCFPLSRSVVAVAGLVVLTAVALGSFWAPAMAMLSDAAETSGLSQGYAVALINLAWAAGQIVGAAGGGALAKATGDFVPFAISALLCAATLGLMLIRPVRNALPR